MYLGVGIRITSTSVVGGGAASTPPSIGTMVVGSTFKVS